MVAALPRMAKGVKQALVAKPFRLRAIRHEAVIARSSETCYGPSTSRSESGAFDEPVFARQSVFHRGMAPVPPAGTPPAGALKWAS